LLISLYTYGVNFTVSMIIVFKKIDNIWLLFYVSQPPDTFKKVSNCVNYKIKRKQSNFERNAKKIFGFEHFSLQIRDIEKNCLLMLNITACIWFQRMHFEVERSNRGDWWCMVYDKSLSDSSTQISVILTCNTWHNWIIWFQWSIACIGSTRPICIAF
jgi:hypothetical protein